MKRDYNDDRVAAQIVERQTRLLHYIVPNTTKSSIPTQELRGLVDLLAREPRRRGIAAHDRLALFERHHVVDVGKAVRRTLLDRVDHALRTAPAVEPHDFGGRRQALLLVRPQRLHGMLGALEPVGEHAGVEDRRRGAVLAPRVTRLWGV